MHVLNSLPNDRILYQTNFKAFADDNSNLVQIIICVPDGVKTHCGKRRKCWLPAFSPFSSMFSKGFFVRVVKSRDFVVKR